MQNFGEKLKKLMFEFNVTQEDLARELGLDQSYISKLKLGKRNPSLKKLEMFAEYFKVPLNFFLQNSGNTQSGNNNIIGNQNTIIPQQQNKTSLMRVVNMCDENTVVKVVIAKKKNLHISSLNYKNAKLVFMKATMLIDDFEEISAKEFNERFKQEVSKEKSVLLILTSGE